METVVTNAIASQPPDQPPTTRLTACANTDFPTIPIIGLTIISNFNLPIRDLGKVWGGVMAETSFRV